MTPSGMNGTLNPIFALRAYPSALCAGHSDGFKNSGKAEPARDNPVEPLETGKWSHLAGVFDGQSLKLYVNGTLAPQSPCQGPSGSSRMAVGRNPYDMSSIFTGLVDDVRVTARALKPAEFGPLNPSGAAGVTRYQPMTIR